MSLNSNNTSDEPLAKYIYLKDSLRMTLATKDVPFSDPNGNNYTAHKGSFYRNVD